MANLLSICQAVARDVGVLVPLAVANNPDVTAAGLFQQAVKTSRRLYKEIDWTVLMREDTFNAVNGTAEYALPTDFGRFIDETAWDRTAYWRMRGPMSPQEWQMAKSGIASTVSTFKRFRIKRAAASAVNKFVLDPTPSDTNSLVFEYISANWCTNAGGTAQANWAADTDLPLIDSDLIELDMTWRMLKRLGRDYQQEKQEADREIATAKSREGGGAPTLSLVGNSMRTPWGNVRDGNWS